jgi:preprotein translocase subunit SecD
MFQPIGLLHVAVAFLLYPCVSVRAQEGPSTLEFRLADVNDTSGWEKMEQRGSDKPIFVSPEVSLNGDHIEKVSFYKDHNGNPCVGLTLTDDGAKAMLITTSKNQKKKLAIVLNGKVVSAPTIQSTIAKNVEITGRFDEDDLRSFFQATVLHGMR